MPNITVQPNEPPPPPGGLGEKIVSGLAYGLQRAFAGIATPLSQVLGNGIADLFDRLELEAAEAYAPAYDWALSLPGLPPYVRELLLGLKTPRHAVQLPLAVVVGSLLTIGGLIGIFGPVSRLGEYQADRVVKTGRLNPAQAMEAIRRGVWTNENALPTIADQGFGEEYLPVWQALTRQYPDLSMLTEMLYRGVIGETDVKGYLTQQGLDAGDAEKVVSILPVMPGVQDLITMAVREAFSPDIIQRFGMMEDFPPDFAKFAAQRGLKPEWAQRYWAMHWSLPSITQGYEMLHRGVISQDDLNTLLRTQDVMPFWRDKLVQVSYNPYTRVDIRRMFNAGVLDQAGVLRAYLDGGYDQEHAQKLTEWTIKQSSEEEKTLVKSELINAYKKRVIDRGTLMASLRDMGYSEQSIELLLGIAEYQKVTEKRSPDRALARGDLSRAYLEGLLSRGDLEAGLTELGYDADESALILKLIDAEARKRKTTGNRDLAKSELESAYTKGVIDPGRFTAALDDLGYDPEERDFIVNLADWKIADHRRTEELEVIRQLYINRYIDRDTVIIKLGQANLPETQVQRYLYLWDIEYEKRLSRPTAAQLTNFAKAGIIPVDRYAEEMVALGYTNEHVEWFVAALPKK